MIISKCQIYYTTADVQQDGIGAILDERVRELFGEEYRHDELVRISVMYAKNGKTAYNGKTYSGLFMSHTLLVTLKTY